jgi:hypothetical protein
VTTDNAQNKYGHRTGAVGRTISEVMQENSVPPMMFHCITYQEVLYSKVLGWNYIMKVIISTVNFIREHGLNHNQFKHILEETEVEFHDILFTAK